MTVIDRPWLFREDDLPSTGAARNAEAMKPAPAWPGPIPRKAFEAHDERTAALIRQYDDLYGLAHAEIVVPLIDEWRWRERMHSPAEKQRFLEPLIARVGRDPEAARGTLIFLLLVCEPVRRGVAKRLLAARSGLESRGTAPDWYRREEARRLDTIERERVVEVTRQGVLEALYCYPEPPPERFFGWLRETVAHRTLDFLRRELAGIDAPTAKREEAEAMQDFLAGFETFDAPRSRERPGLEHWRWLVRQQQLFEVAGDFWQYEQVRRICRGAIDRLPLRQREVIEGHFFDGLTPEELAARRGISRSTVYNQKAQALQTLHDDDVYFCALSGLRLVRDHVRRRQIVERYPDGRVPDGRRLVVIDEAA